MNDGPCIDVCALDDGGGDSPDFYSEKLVTARKPHKCCECGKEIAKGEKHWLCRGKWDGEISVHRQCTICREIALKYGCDGFAFGQVWEQLTENLFPTMRIGCLDGLSAAAKQKVMDEWRQWKFS
jgi:hypothetical protein